MGYVLPCRSLFAVLRGILMHDGKLSFCLIKTLNKSRTYIVLIFPNRICQASFWEMIALLLTPCVRRFIPSIAWAVAKIYLVVCSLIIWFIFVSFPPEKKRRTNSAMTGIRSCRRNGRSIIDFGTLDAKFALGINLHPELMKVEWILLKESLPPLSVPLMCVIVIACWSRNSAIFSRGRFSTAFPKMCTRAELSV